MDKYEKDELINDFLEFEKSEKWYTDRSISYKRGYMFYGEPGNGKTSLCLSIAKKLKRDLYFLNSDLENNSSLLNAIRTLKPNSILALEDVDCMFEHRQNVSTNNNNDKKEGVTMSGLLNCLDGAMSKENVITILTTNHIEKLDPALIRVGRIDKKYKINNPNKDMIEQYLKVFYDSKISLDFDVQNDHSLSMSTIQDLCIINKNSSMNAIASIKKEMLKSKVNNIQPKREYLEIINN